MKGSDILLVAAICMGVVYVALHDSKATPKFPNGPAIPGYVKILKIFSTDACAPCVALKASLKDPGVSKLLTGWVIREIDSPEEAQAAGVSSYPTVEAVMQVGSEARSLGRFSGSKTPAELRAWLIALDSPRFLAQAKVAGPIAPDGKTEIHCDLPADQHCKNVSSRGEGCCTQTSMNHSARWQNVPALVDFHKWVQEKGLPGGGTPGTMRDRIPKCAKDRGYPVPEFIQVEGADLEILKAACKSGRMPGVTYSRSPTGRYGGQSVSHMVSLVHADDNWFAVLDNNYIGEDQIEWMTPEEFKKTYAPGGDGWSVVLLQCGPPPPPRNVR